MMKRMAIVSVIALFVTYLTACDTPIEPHLDVTGMTFALISFNGIAVPYTEWFGDSTASVERLGGTLVFSADSVFVESKSHELSPNVDVTRIDSLRGSYEALGTGLVLLTFPCELITSSHVCDIPAKDDLDLRRESGLFVGDTLFTSHNWNGMRNERVWLRVSGG